jgi:uncharacterized DUF497 family protein
MYSFEFDENKSLKNKQKHGIDFIEAQKLWEYPKKKIFPAKNLDEVRYILHSYLNGKCWSAIFTIRGSNIRIISVRRCRKKEEIILNES